MCTLNLTSDGERYAPYASKAHTRTSARLLGLCALRLKGAHRTSACLIGSCALRLKGFRAHFAGHVIQNRIHEFGFFALWVKAFGNIYELSDHNFRRRAT